MFKKLNLQIYTEKMAKEAVNLLKQSNVKALSGNGRFKVIASCESIDRDGEMIMVDGWDFSNYIKNPIILWGHNYWDLKAIIGACDSIAIQELDGVKCMVMEGVFANTDEGQQARQLYDDGILKTVSVGFIPKERNGNIITKQELLELSFVSVPSNPDATSLMKALAETMVTKTLDILKTSKKAVKGMDELIQDLRDDLQASVDDFVEDLADGGADEAEEGEADEGKRLAHAVIKELNTKFLKSEGSSDTPTVPDAAQEDEKAQLKILELKIASLEADQKSGRVLSEKNRTLIKTVIDNLQALHEASEPEKAHLPGVAKELQMDLQSFVKMVEKSIKNSKILTSNL